VLHPWPRQILPSGLLERGPVDVVLILLIGTGHYPAVWDVPPDSGPVLGGMLIPPMQRAIHLVYDLYGFADQYVGLRRIAPPLGFLHDARDGQICYADQGSLATAAEAPLGNSAQVEAHGHFRVIAFVLVVIVYKM
jgi:hypothetical protein